MSTYQVLPGSAGIVAIERNDSRAIVSVHTFPTQLAARQWVLGQLDVEAHAESTTARARMSARFGAPKHDDFSTFNHQSAGSRLPS